MSVLQRKELEDSPLADLHAIASELGIDGYRALRREDLVGAILDVQGGGSAPDAEADGGGEIEDAPEAELAEDEAEADEEPEDEADAETRGRRRSRRSGRGRRGRGRARSDDDGSDDDGSDEQEDGAAGEGAGAREPEAERDGRGGEDDDAEREVASGMLDVLPNGSGFVRRDDGDPVHVSPAQIRRCELRAGDDVSGPVRPPRRNERHPSLVQVESVNGRDPEPPEERPLFEALTPVHASERLAAPEALGDVPLGKGSRVAIAGPAGAGATRLLRELVGALAGADGVSVAVVLAGARPEETTEWRREATVPVSGGSFDEPAEDQAQAALLAVERAKRTAERGGDAIVAIDSLAAVEPDVARRVFGAGRKLEEGGSVTVVAIVDERSDELRLATTRVVLEPGADGPRVAAERSGAQRADLLA